MRKVLNVLMWSFLAVLFSWSVLLFLDFFRTPKLDLTCNVVHETKNGCPAGYRRVEHPVFTEKDGTKQNACFSPDSHKEDCTDFISPGESFEVTVPVVIEKPSVKGPRT